MGFFRQLEEFLRQLEDKQARLSLFEQVLAMPTHVPFAFYASLEEFDEHEHSINILESEVGERWVPIGIMADSKEYRGLN